jgi:hypothetical protein
MHLVLLCLIRGRIVEPALTRRFDVESPRWMTGVSAGVVSSDHWNFEICISVTSYPYMLHVGEYRKQLQWDFQTPFCVSLLLEKWGENRRRSRLAIDNRLVTKLLRVCLGMLLRFEIPAKRKKSRNSVLCEKVCCSGTFSHAWKHYLVQITPANLRFYLDPQFHQDCIWHDGACNAFVTCVMHQLMCTWAINLTCIETCCRD